jgi:putative intracellular protease/amidase
MPPAPAGRIVVAVVLGPRGSVGTDALAPYEVFARSPAFLVYTVSAGRAASVLSGGLALVPEHSLEDVDAGSAPEPDVVVVPAVAGPAGKELAPLRDWIARRAYRGAHILGVCAGSVLLAAAGLLNGRRATSHWSNIASLRCKHPQVNWVRGQRYVVDGSITTTGGVTSGIFGALRLVGQLAGAAEAERVGRELAYPGWRSGAPAGMPVQRVAAGDLSYALTVAFPWFRPTVGIVLVEGVGEIDAAAAFDIYAGNSSAARAVPIAAGSTVTTRHGLQLLAQPAGAGAPRVDRLVVPGARDASEVDPRFLRWAADQGLDIELPHAGQPDGEFSFDPLLRDLAAHADMATARSTAKNTEYPTAHLLAAHRPSRPHYGSGHRHQVPPGSRQAAAAVTHTPVPTPIPQREQPVRAPVLWGLAFGAIQAASPLALRWLDQATVQALLLSLIAAVYIGFAVADGRPKVIAVESSITGAFVLLAAAGVTGSAWLLVLGYAGHGLKDFWQERSHYVADTRWWPPFCAAVDWLVAVVLLIEIIAGAGFHH